jgi:hypothetical protein
MSLTVESDAVDYVRCNPSVFFPEGVVSVHRLIARLTEEIIALGGRDVSIVCRNDWWVVSSECDWFVPETSVEVQVRRLIPLPEAGLYATRVEVLIVAFAAAFSTRGADGTWIALTGATPPPDVECLNLPPSRRTVAFRL